ncbi:hypothetical protein [uncultured Massilia sp.]|uniref:hypothetical protein n=1 Tax=uncultured Massilia sp. TaxID=169973 RepID=UPI0025DA07C6|nr:hypothetical protein [uncultured Massilia sp.]
MNTTTIPACALACALLAASAAPPARAQAAADPRAPAPDTVYRPALDYRAEAQSAASPDRNWRASNGAVAGYNPMTLTMKSMDGHAGHPMPQTGAADPHAGHAMDAGAPAPATAAGHAAHQHGDRR